MSRVKTITLDANAFMRLEDVDGYDQSLNEVLRRGLDGFYKVAVTSELMNELQRDPVPSRYARNLQKLEKFPVVPMPEERLIISSVQQIMPYIFPHANSQRNNYPNKISDCRQVAIHLLSDRDYFITADQKLLAGIKRLPNSLKVQAGTASDFLKDVFYPRIEPERRPLVLPSISIRRAAIEDEEAVFSLLQPVRGNYPGFTDWLRAQFQKMSSGEVEIKVAVANEVAIAGVSIGKPKGMGIWKLSTFYVDPQYQNNRLGQHLIFNEVQTWINEGITKVTVTSDLSNSVLKFLKRVGFVVEGLAPERYPGRTEAVMGRQFIRRTFSSSDFSALAKTVAERLLGAHILSEEPEEVMCESSLSELPWYMTVTPKKYILRPMRGDDNDAQKFGIIIDRDNEITQLDAWDLETIFHPLVLTWPERKAFIIPIYEDYANQLFEMYRPQPRLITDPVTSQLLQMDNVYYCTVRYTDVITRGTPLLFYVTKEPNRGSGVAGTMVAMAIVRSVAIDTPDVLYVEHGQRGVYNLEEIKKHAKGQSKAMAIHFSWLRPFPNTIPHKDVKRLVPNWVEQGFHSISHNHFLELCRRGGVPLGIDAALV